MSYTKREIKTAWDQTKKHKIKELQQPEQKEDKENMTNKMTVNVLERKRTSEHIRQDKLGSRKVKQRYMPRECLQAKHRKTQANIVPHQAPSKIQVSLS